MRQTTNVKHLEVNKKWFILDVEGQVLGRVAQFIAFRLAGKYLPNYTSNVDMGDNIVVINAGKILLTSNKLNTKLYYRHSGYPGGLKVRTANEQMRLEPTLILRKAISGMLPKTKLGKKQLKNLYLYSEANHKHQAQQPQKLEII